MIEQEGSSIRILIADDHQVVRRGLQVYLELESDFLIVGEAVDGREAAARYTSLKPDILLLDLQMKPVGGLEALRAIMAEDAQARVIVLTSFFDATHVLPAIEAGAVGYLLKTADPQEIVTAIRAAMSHRRTYDPEVMQAMAQGLQQRAVLEDLTEREGDVLRLVAQGKSNQEIADALFIGVKTVKTHVSNILAKLHVEDRTQAAVFALRHGLLESGE